MPSRPIPEALAYFDDCIRMAAGGDPVVLTKDGRAVAALVSVEMLENLGVVLGGQQNAWDQPEEMLEQLGAHVRTGGPPRYDGS
jgi:prevent-host-death family protein